MTAKKRVESNAPATGGVTGKGFKPGQSGNPGGKKALPPEVKEALAADTLWLYEKAKALAIKAEEEGDLKTAGTIVLGLLKKTMPDAQTPLTLGEGGGLTVVVKTLADAKETPS